MVKTQLVADTSFYSLFISDIQSPSYLIRILENFTAIIPPKVSNELDKLENHESVIEIMALLPI